MTAAYRPADLILGLDAHGVALVRGGRLVALQAAAAAGQPWPRDAVLAALQAIDTPAVAVEQLATVTPAGGALARGLARRQRERWARQVLGAHAAFVRAGRMGTAVLRVLDRRDRVTEHPRDRCLAAAAGYTAGWRDGLVVVADDGASGRCSLWRATSGKLVSLGSEELDLGRPVAALVAISSQLDIPRVALAGARLAAPRLLEQLGEQPGIQAAWCFPRPDLALAAGAALVAWADERQGAWVPAPLDPSLWTAP